MFLYFYEYVNVKYRWSRLIMGSSLVKTLMPIHRTRIQSIPGGCTTDLWMWLQTEEGLFSAAYANSRLLFIGGNDLANGRRPEAVAQSVCEIVAHLKDIGDGTISVAGLPPRPALDSRSDVRSMLNYLLETRSNELDFKYVSTEHHFIDSHGKTVLKYYKPKEVSRGRAIHFNEEGSTRLRLALLHGLGTGRHRGPSPRPYIIKPHQIGHMQSYHL